MSTNTKPRICEVLGVEVGEQFCIKHPDVEGCEFYVCKDGLLLCDEEISDYGIYIAINHPESIIRQPRFTEDEVADAKAMRRMFPEVVTLSRGCDGHLICGNKYRMVQLVLQPDAKAFPSIRPGQSVAIIDIIGK